MWAGQVSQQGSRPSRPGADVEDAVAGSDLKQAQHRRDRAWLGVGLSVTDGDRAVEVGAESGTTGEEPRTWNSREGGPDRVHGPTQPPARSPAVRFVRVC